MSNNPVGKPSREQGRTPNSDAQSSHVRAGVSATAQEDPEAADDLPPGTVVGEYVVDRTLGRGGMGVVYAAHQPIIDKRVAIKVLAAQGSAGAELLQRFIDEARAVNRIGHPNIIDIFSFGQLASGEHYYVMELLRGQTLRERMDAGRCSTEEVREIIQQLCQGLEAAHRAAIVHRDLKPENIWIDDETEARLRVKILDFGIAKLLDRSGQNAITQTGTALGTPYFMAPEQCRGQAVNARADIYALGVLLYELLTESLPFEGNTLMAVLVGHMTDPPPPPSTRARMVPAVERLILQCLEKSPQDRPASALEVAQRLQQGLASASEASRAPAIASAPPPASRRRTPILLGAALAGVLVAGGGFLLSSYSPNTRESPDTRERASKAVSMAAPAPMPPTPTHDAATLDSKPQDPAEPPSKPSPKAENGAPMELGTVNEGAPGAPPRHTAKSPETPPRHTAKSPETPPRHTAKSPETPQPSTSHRDQQDASSPGEPQPPGPQRTAQAEEAKQPTPAAAHPEPHARPLTPVEKRGLATENPFQ